MEFLQYPLALVVTLGVLITFHELGHFVVARWSGVRVVRFSIGFGRPLWSRVDRHGTEFVVAAIPFGGYVRMLDEHEPGEVVPAAARADTDVAHGDLSVWWRIAIAAAGPAANFLLAFIVYWFLFVAGSSVVAPVLGAMPADSPLARAGLTADLEVVSVDGVLTPGWQHVNMALAARLGDSGEVRLSTRRPGGERVTRWRVPIQDWHTGAADPDLLASLGFVPKIPAVIAEIVPEGAAARGGQLRQWDRVEAVDGKPIADWFDWVTVIQAAPEQELQVTVERDGVSRTVIVEPDAREAADGTMVGFLGVGRFGNTVRYGVIEAVPKSVAETWSKSALTLGFVKKMLTGHVSVKNLSSPIMIAKVAGDSARSGWRYYLGLLALLSISLGILNLLPVPVLDGGHILFCLVEIVRGKPLPERAQIVGTQIGVVLVMSLAVVAVYNDIMRLL